MKKFAKIFLFSSLGLLVVACLFLFLAPEKSQKLDLVEASDDMVLSATPHLAEDIVIFNAPGQTEVQNQASFGRSFVQASNVIYDVMLINFQDSIVFTEDSYSEYLAIFQEASNWFTVHSEGKTTVQYNVSVALIPMNSKDYIQGSIFNVGISYYLSQLELFDQAKNLAHTQLVYYGEAQGKIMNLALNEPVDWGNKGWPHVCTPQFSTLKDRLMTINCFSKAGTIVHETLHTLGLTDLYSNTGNEVVGYTDVMANSSTEMDTSAQNKKFLGWFEESSYEDNISTDIEVISQTGTYTLDLSYSKTGVNAYKFGINAKEFFMIEQRNFSNGTQRLVVQRVNLNFCENMGVKDQKDAYIYAFDNGVKGDMLAKYFHKYSSVGNSKNPLFYADGTRAYYLIDNIKTNPEKKQMSFDFTVFSNDEQIDASQVITEPQTTAVEYFYVCAKRANGENVEPSNILIYNSLTKKYESAKNIQKLYLGSEIYYKFKNQGDNYTKLKVEVSEMFITSSQELPLEQFVNKYVVNFDDSFGFRVSETLLDIRSSIGGFFSGIFTTVIDIFK